MQVSKAFSPLFYSRSEYDPDKYPTPDRPDPDKQSSSKTVSNKPRGFKPTYYPKDVTVVDLRHRIPFDPDFKSIRAIEEEMRSVPRNVYHEFRTFRWFFASYKDYILDFYQLHIISYLEGKCSVNEMLLTRENGAYFLRLAKLADLAFICFTRVNRKTIQFKNTTYALRTYILELLSPELTTTDVYTLSIDPEKLKNVDYLKDPSNWVPERIGLYAKIISQEYIKSIALANRLNDPEPHIYALRGNTASGKSTLAKDRFSHALDEKGELSGCINPDNLKYVLKMKTSQKCQLTNMQVHEEVVRGPLSSYKVDVLHQSKCSVIVDTRLSSVEDFEECVLAPAMNRKRKATIIDIDVPISLSLQRVLTQRNPQGKSACAPPKAIKDGFQETRRCRTGIIERVRKETLIEDYELISTDKEGNTQLVAQKKGSSFEVIFPKFFEECLQPLSEEALDQESKQKITLKSIQDAVVSYRISASEQDVMKLWQNFTLEKALEFHARGLSVQEAHAQLENEAYLREKYGIVVLEPFSDAWLLDHPHIKVHLDSEHLLHIRGCDEEGRGLNWQTNKFASRLDPAFNPESKGGFQMKVGYFIIPRSNAELFKSLSLSPAIEKELEVRDAAGNLIGYRFFVHSEAYEHFQTLHHANIPFVKPENSEFIGTPTSSYRSWAIRHIEQMDNTLKPKPNSVPFIVKLGVGKQFDNSRLLSRKEVKQSIEKQILFDKMRMDPGLMIFPESFGIALKNIPNYPTASNINTDLLADSGMIIREFPQEFLEGKCQIFSFSALMSLEKLKYPDICNHDKHIEKPLPLIYSILENAIDKGLVKTPFEFIQRYLIENVFKALDSIVFQEGLSLAIHGQNLCMVLNQDYTPRGIAIRDHGDIHKIKRYLETYTWFYRYHVFIKLMNVMTSYPNDTLPPIKGAPIQIGHIRPVEERNLHHYLFKKIAANPLESSVAMNSLQNLSISFQEYELLLNMMDQNFLTLLSNHFGMENIAFLMKDIVLPAAEVGSQGETQLTIYNRMLWNPFRS